jgi:hypothetical protein
MNPGTTAELYRSLITVNREPMLALERKTDPVAPSCELLEVPALETDA